MTRIPDDYKSSRDPSQKRKDARSGKSETAVIQEVSLKEAMNQYKYASRVEGKAKKTLEQYDYVFDKFLEFLPADTPIKAITPSDVRGFLNNLMNKSLAKATVAIHHRVLQALFNWLVREDLLDKAPTANIKEPKTPKQYQKVLNEDQTNKLVRAAEGNKGSWTGYRNFTIIVCFLDIGLRLTELVDTRLIDLNFEERTLKVRGKGAKDRMVYFGLETYRALRKWIGMRDMKGKPKDNTIFISRTGEKLKKRYVQHIVTNLQQEAGLEEVQVSPHVLRHTAATLAVKNGMGAFPLQWFFGWESIRTAMRYVHMNGEAVRDSFQKASPMDNLRE